MSGPTPGAATGSRTTLKRAPERGNHDRAVIESILDDGYLCHVGIATERGPVVIPTLYTRMGDQLILHGSPASRLLRSARSADICVTVSLVDGFVLARSALHHSMNYRSVVIFGTPEQVPAEEKAAALDALVDKLVPGRRAHLRPMLDTEVRATLVLRLPIDEASAKIRTGGPIDEPEDYDLPIWAGVVPITTSYGEPLTDPDSRVAVPIPDHVREFTAG